MTVDGKWGIAGIILWWPDLSITIRKLSHMEGGEGGWVGGGAPISAMREVRYRRECRDHMIGVKL